MPRPFGIDVRTLDGGTRWLALLALCSAYLQGGVAKVTDFAGAIAEMQHFGLTSPELVAAAVIAVEIGASLLILSGRYRWAGAIALAGFTLGATFVANRFWELDGIERVMATNAFFEHLGLIGAFMLVAWQDLRPDTRLADPDQGSHDRRIRAETLAASARAHRLGRTPRRSP